MPDNELLRDHAVGLGNNRMIGLIDHQDGQVSLYISQTDNRVGYSHFTDLGLYSLFTYISIG